MNFNRFLSLVLICLLGLILFTGCYDLKLGEKLMFPKGCKDNDEETDKDQETQTPAVSLDKLNQQYAEYFITFIDRKNFKMENAKTGYRKALI